MGCIVVSAAALCYPPNMGLPLLLSCLRWFCTMTKPLFELVRLASILLNLWFVEIEN